MLAGVKRTQIYLEERQARELERRAAARHTTKSELIREALDAYLLGGDRKPSGSGGSATPSTPRTG